MNAKILFSALIFGVAAFSASADDSNDIRKEINRIKKSSQYIYAESTAPTEADARSNAEIKLYDAVSAWVATQKKIKDSFHLVVNNRSELWTTLSMPRGSNMFRYFIYVKKKDVIPTENAVVITNKSQPAVEEDLQKELPEAICALAAHTRYANMAAQLKEFKAQGKIKSYTRYAALENPDACYLIIYNKEGEVVATLSPGKERLNLKTNKPDSIKNYSGCGAIGVEL